MPQLAALIRSKHPGAYDDMDDDTLEKSVLEKYPEYKDLAEERRKPVTSKSEEITLKPEQYNAEEQNKRLETLKAANARPISEPTTFIGGFLKSIGDYAKGGFGFDKGDFRSMLESAANPRSLGDFMQLLIPGEVNAARALSKSPELVPSVPRGNLGRIAETAISEPMTSGPIRHDLMPSPGPEFWPVGEEVLGANVKPTGGMSEQAIYDLARKKTGMGAEMPESMMSKVKEPPVMGKAPVGEPGFDDILKNFGGAGHPENPEFVSNVLGAAGKGKPGLSVEPIGETGASHVVYRNPAGDPIGVAKVVQDSSGKMMVQDLALDKSKGLLGGRAMKDIARTLKEMDAVEPAGTISPDAQNFLDKMVAKSGGKSPIRESFPEFTYEGQANERLGEFPPSSQTIGEIPPPTGVPERQSLLASERGSVGPFGGEKPEIPKAKPRYRLDTETGMGIPIDEAGNQIGTAVSPEGQAIRPDLATFSKYNQTGRMANESQKKTLWGEFRDANRAILTAFDFSPLGRQGKPFLLNKEYYTSLDDMFKSWGSQRAYEAVKDSITSHPNFRPDEFGNSLAKRAGLDYLGKEEMFQSNIAEKLVPGVRRSERAYNAFLSKLRADSFNRMVSDAEAAGMNPKKNDVLLKQFGSFINDATGRGSLGKLEKAAPILNETFFAPRLMASRVNMYKRFLNPMTYSNENPILRKQTLKSLIATVGFGLGVGELAKLGGAQVSNDPNSADFRKIKIGNSRLDPFSGFQQYAVGASRILNGELTSTSPKNYGRSFDLTTGKMNMPSRRSVTEQFFANKLAPVPSLIWSWMGGREFDGTPFEMKKAILNRTVPIVMQDLYDIYQEDPKMFPPGIFKKYPTATKIGMGIAPIFGEGIQTYAR